MTAISIPTSDTGGAAGSAQTAAKATAPAIFMVDPSSAAFILPKPPMPTLVCRYNPKTLSISGGTEWTTPETTGQEDTPAIQFQATKPRTLSVELLVDLFFLPYGNVDWELRALQDWCTGRANFLGQRSAPYLRFQWGESRYFKCRLDSYTINHTMFSKSGAPMRAKVSVQLTEVLDAQPGTNPSSGGEGGEGAHVVRAGDTLHSIAHSNYGRARFWRGLAAFNGIDDPTRLPAGTVVGLPETSVVDDLSQVT